MLGKGMLAIVVVLVKPFRFLGRMLIRVLLPIYRLLFNAKHRLAPAAKRAGTKPSLLSLMTSKYIIHATVITLTLGVAVNNVSARGSGLGDFGSDSIMGAYTKDENAQDVIEKALPVKVAYLDKKNAISPEVTFEAELGMNESTDPVIADTGNALTVPTLSGEDIPQRSDVTTYIVQNGDTIGGIANRFGITQRTVLNANNLTNADFIKPGQELVIPPITGVLHKVAKGDTVASIASKYKVEAQEILDFNHLADASAISIDQTIIVPGGEIPEVVPERPAQSRPGRSGFAGPVPGPAPAIGGGRLNWPTVGRKINQYFRYGHTGIDVECNYSNPIYAARAGTVSAVIYARYGYGYHIIISHGGGLQTLYGHNSKIFVKPGQKVTQGQTIAMCGSTGRSTGTHVHFETIVNGRKTNPLSYL